MILQLTGTLLSIDTNHLAVLDVNGIGYGVYTTLWQAPQANTTWTCFTHMIYREDSQTIYGFATPEERDIFRNIIKTNGIGPKVALNLLNQIQYRDLMIIIRDKQLHALEKAKGIGKKGAQKIMLEMQRYVEQWTHLNLSSSINDTTSTTESALMREVTQALVQLGYKQNHIKAAIDKIKPDIDPSNTNLALTIKQVLEFI